MNQTPTHRPTLTLPSCTGAGRTPRARTRSTKTLSSESHFFELPHAVQFEPDALKTGGGGGGGSHQLRARRALTPFKDVLLRTRAPFHKELRLIVLTIDITRSSMANCVLKKRKLAINCNPL